MSDEWDIRDKGPSSGGVAGEALTLGFAAPLHEFECTHKQTGEVKTVWAYSVRQAGEKIANGEFDE